MSEEKGKESGKEAEKIQEFSFCVPRSCLPGIWHLSKQDPTYKIFIFKTGFEDLTSHCHLFSTYKTSQNLFLHC